MENYNLVKGISDDIYYYLNDKLHRLDGSAVKYSNGDKEWWQNGLRHRLDGAAIEWSDGYKKWFYEGEMVCCNSQEEFERLIKLKLFW